MFAKYHSHNRHRPLLNWVERRVRDGYYDDLSLMTTELANPMLENTVSLHHIFPFSQGFGVPTDQFCLNKMFSLAIHKESFTRELFIFINK